jgi:hypothetical protein
VNIRRIKAVRGIPRAVAKSTPEAQSGMLVGQAVTLGLQVGKVPIDANNPPRNHGGGSSVISDIAFKLGG